MFPSQGMGWLDGMRRVMLIWLALSLFNHIIFGLGLALWMAVMRPI